MLAMSDDDLDCAKPVRPYNLLLIYGYSVRIC